MSETAGEDHARRGGRRSNSRARPPGDRARRGGGGARPQLQPPGKPGSTGPAARQYAPVGIERVARRHHPLKGVVEAAAGSVESKRLVDTDCGPMQAALTEPTLKAVQGFCAGSGICRLNRETQWTSFIANHGTVGLEPGFPGGHQRLRGRVGAGYKWRGGGGVGDRDIAAGVGAVLFLGSNASHVGPAGVANRHAVAAAK